jgi:hypothetical protein
MGRRIIAALAMATGGFILSVTATPALLTPMAGAADLIIVQLTGAAMLLGGFLFMGAALFRTLDSIFGVRS